MAKLVKSAHMSMQSQPGRFCDEKYRTLKLQENKFTAHSLSPASSLPDFYSKVDKPQRPTVLEQLLSAKKSLPAEPLPQRHTWAFAAQSRAEYYKAMSSKDHIPSTGYYLPKYDSVFRAPPAPVIPPVHSHRPAPVAAVHPEEEEKLAKKLLLPSVPFHLQLSRPDITSFAPDVSEKRFESVSPSPASSSVKRVRSVNFTKMLRRPNYAQARPHPRYNPNYAVISRKVVPDIDFGKLTSRSQQPLPRSSQLAYGNVQFSQTAPRARSSLFTMSRPESDIFPTHMVKVYTRASLNVLQAAALRSASAAEARKSDTARSAVTDR